MPTRALRFIALAVALAATATARAQAAPPTSLDLTARHVDYFSDRYIVTADGDVRIRLSDGTVLRGDTFSMDLKLNRYLIAGDVRLDSAGVHQVGAAFAGYPDLDRSYFLPATGVPDRWTYFGLNFADPHPGREQPGDAFFFPDLSGQRPYIVATGATIIPKTNVMFSNAGVRVLTAYVPTPRYVVTFSANPHFAENAFFGARFDIGEPFNGSAHSLSALHVRNDPVNGTYLAIDQHFVWDRDWIVASIDPLTQEQRQYNLIGYKRVSPKVELRVFEQLSQGQPGGPVAPPINSSSFTNVQLNAGLRHSGVAFNLNQYNWDLLGIPDVAYDKQYFPLQLEHPINMSLSWIGYENRFAGTGLGSRLLFRLRSGIGWAHDQYGVGGYLGYLPGPENLWYKYAGGTIYTPSYNVGKFTVTAKFDKQRQWYSLPHHVDTTDTGASLSRAYPHINSYLSYDVMNVGDFWGAQQSIVYPTPAAPVVTQNQYGTFVNPIFQGFGTARTLLYGLVWTPSPDFALNVMMSKHDDTPGPVPGVYGQPPWQLSGDMRLRFTRQFQVDLTRAYYFNFANLRWTPQWGIQFSP